MTELSFPYTSEPSPKLSRMSRNLWATSWWIFYSLIVLVKSRDLSWCSVAQKSLTHADAHTSGITAQTWRQRVTNSPLPFCHSAAPLEQMGDECWREERTLFSHFFSFPVCPHSPSQPVMLYESLTHLTATN